MEFFIFVILFGLGIFLISRAVNSRQYLKAISVSQIDEMDGIGFEHYVRELLVNQGYSAHVTRGSNDYGVDIVAKKDGNRYAIQVKRYSSSVSRRAVSDAVAGMKQYNCNKSIVITNSFFSKGANELASSNSCTLVDRTTLGKWIYQFQGTTPQDLHLMDVPIVNKNLKPSKGLASEKGKTESYTGSTRSNVSKDSNSVTETGIDKEVALIAKREYPRDTEMREYEYRQQLSSKRYMKDVEDLEVKKIAQREYPNDYTMQEDEYKRQLISKMYMENVKDTEIAQIALNEYPDDYIMQEDTYKEQLNSKHFILSLPNNRKKRNAQLEYPNDYSMQEYEYRNS